MTKESSGNYDCAGDMQLQTLHGALSARCTFDFDFRCGGGLESEVERSVPVWFQDVRSLVVE